MERFADPTDAEFVDAVIHTHERIRSELQALSRGASRPGDDGTAEDAEIIRAYCLSHGVDTRKIGGSRRVEPRWLAV